MERRLTATRPWGAVPLLLMLALAGCGERNGTSQMSQRAPDDTIAYEAGDPESFANMYYSLNGQRVVRVDTCREDEMGRDAAADSAGAMPPGK
ncbi:MAG: hypothetical protein IPH86_12695 [bacterium]|nr:hypothetical protein [bacterium]